MSIEDLAAKCERLRRELGEALTAKQIAERALAEALENRENLEIVLSEPLEKRGFGPGRSLLQRVISMGQALDAARKDGTTTQLVTPENAESVG